MLTATVAASDDDDDGDSFFGDNDSLIENACQWDYINYNYTQNVVYVVDDICVNAPKEEDGYKSATYSSDDGNSSVYGLAQCRADVANDSCSECLNKAATTIRTGSRDGLCPNKNTTGAMVVHNNCFLMYTNQNFFGQPYIWFDKNFMITPLCRGREYTDNAEALLARQVVRSLFDSLLNISKTAQRKFAIGSAESVNGSVVQAMVECRRELDEGNCKGFLADLATTLLLYCGKFTQGGLFLEGSSVKFEWKS